MSVYSTTTVLPNLKGYALKQQVGVGAFGRVYFAERTIDSLPVAIKVIDLDAAHDNISVLMSEVSNMNSVDHPNVVSLIDCFVPVSSSNELAVVLEWIGGGSLAELLEMKAMVTEDALCAIVVDALEGLKHLHEDCHLVHRDIKGSNLMISRDGVVKLSDFGSAGAILGSEGQRNTAIGTAGWIAPEVAASLRDPQTGAKLSVGYDAADYQEAANAPPAASELDATAVYRSEYKFGYRYEADIWSLATTILELVAGAPSLEALKVVRRAAAARTAIPEGLMRPNSKPLSAAFVSFVARMLAVRPCDRPSAAELLDDPVLSKMRDDDTRRRVLADLSRAIPDSYARPGQPSKHLRASTGEDDASLGSNSSADDSVEGSDDDDAAVEIRGGASSSETSSTPIPTTTSSKPPVDEEPSTCPTLRSTRWQMVNPAVVSILRGKDVALSSAVTTDQPPSVYQRTKAAAGLRTAQLRDERAFLTSIGAIPMSAGQLLSTISRPFGGLYTRILAPGLRGMWAPSVLPAASRPPADGATRDLYVADVEAKLAACEAAVPGFSARLLVGLSEGVGKEPGMLKQLQSIAARNRQGRHADATASATTDRAVWLNRGTAGGGPSVAPGSHPQSQANTHGMETVNLVPPARSGAMHPSLRQVAAQDYLTQLAVVVTAAGSSATGRDASVDVSSFLFERWKADLIAANRAGR